MGLINDLQERKPKRKVKSERTQTDEISLKPPVTRKRTPSPIGPTRITPDLPEDFIKPNTRVYAVWFDRDCFVYEVCSNFNILLNKAFRDYHLLTKPKQSR
jgi:hypothetical protein